MCVERLLRTQNYSRFSGASFKEQFQPYPHETDIPGGYFQCFVTEVKCQAAGALLWECHSLEGRWLWVLTCLLERSKEIAWKLLPEFGS